MAKQNPLQSLAAYLIGEARKTGMLDGESRYSHDETMLVIDSDEALQSTYQASGDDEAMAMLRGEIGVQLDAEESSMNATKAAAAPEDGLSMLESVIKGKGWVAAKCAIQSLHHGARKVGTISDVEAETLFEILTHAAEEGRYKDTAMVRGMSPFRDEYGEGQIRRLDEVGQPMVGVEKGITPQDEAAFLEKMGWRDCVPTAVDVFRGVSFIKSSIRAGDMVTPARDYARSYVRGGHGGVLKSTVPSSDLVLYNADPDRPEFIYLPKNLPTTSRDGQRVTFRDFFDRINETPLLPGKATTGATKSTTHAITH